MTPFQLITGLQILEKYLNRGLHGFDVAAEHDIIYVHIEADLVSEEDAAQLTSLGWHVSSTSHTWAAYT